MQDPPRARMQPPMLSHDPIPPHTPSRVWTFPRSPCLLHLSVPSIGPHRTLVVASVPFPWERSFLLFIVSRSTAQRRLKLRASFVLVGYLFILHAAYGSPSIYLTLIPHCIAQRSGFVVFSLFALKLLPRRGGSFANSIHQCQHNL